MRVLKLFGSCVDVTFLDVKLRFEKYVNKKMQC